MIWTVRLTTRNQWMWMKRIPCTIMRNLLRKTIRNICHETAKSIRPFIRHCRLNKEDDDVDLKISVWNVDLFTPYEDQISPKKAASSKSKRKFISTKNSSATLAGNVRFDDRPTDSCPKGPSPGEVLQALTTYDISYSKKLK